ncbi:hypothetical protein LXA43DRAFT_1178971 [Ganoderma leucocontextum]|nr:hypothetical protein LXA43DRAFT_1178971 [Ganoderma leucocontextum]
MNNGDGQNNPQFPINELTLVDPNSVVTPEVYANDMQRIQNMRSYLASYEENLAARYTKYRDLEEKHRLEATVRQGQLALQRLGEMEGRMDAGANPAPASAGPSNAQQSIYTSQLHGHAAGNYSEVPSSARIVEVPSSQDSPQMERRSSTASSSRSETQAPPNRPRVPVASYNAPQGYAYSYQPFQDWTAFGASPSVMYGHGQPLGAHAQQSSYQSGRWAAPAPSHYRPETYYPGVPVQAPSLAPSTSRTAQQAHHAGSQQAGCAPQAEHVASGPSYPVSSRSTQVRVDSVNRPNVAHSSGSAGRPGQSSAPVQVQPPAGIPQIKQQQLFQYFQTFSVPEAQAMMLQTVHILQRKHTGREKTAADIEAEGKLKGSIVKNSEVLADHLKGYPGSEIKEVFRRYLSLASRQQQAAARPGGGRGSSVEKAPPQHPQPSTSTSTPLSAPPPQSNRVKAQPSAPIHPPVSQSTVKHPSSATPTVAASAESTTVSVPATSTSTPTSTFNTAPAGSQYTQMSWYTPRDPTAPIMVRDAKGRIQWIHRQPLPQPSAPSKPPSTPPASKAAPHPEPPATPQPRPASEAAAWTPEKANRSRLAQDIMRSLGRPKGAFGAPLSPTDTIPTPRFEVIHPPTETPTATAKRKASSARSSPASPTAAKRQRLDGQAPAAAATLNGPLDAAAVGVVVPAVEREATPVAVGPAVAPLPPRPEHGVEQEADEVERVDHVESATPPPADADVDALDHDMLPGLTDTDTVRGVSITSSEAANIDRALDVLLTEPEPEPIQDGVPPRGARASSDSSGERARPAGIMYAVSGERAQEGVGIPDATSSPLHGFSAAASNATPPPSSPAPSLREKGKEKEPLFLPSPSGSPGPSVYDEDIRSDASAGPLLLGSRKGKGRALDTDLDLTLLADGDEASERSSPVPRKRRRVNRAYVLAPPLPAYASALRGNGVVWLGSRSPSSSVASGSRYGTPSSASKHASASKGDVDADEESEDELAEWHGRSLFADESVCDENVDQGPRVAADEEVGPVVEPETDDEEAAAAAELAFSCLRETPCSWTGCGVVLNSKAALQRHIVLHADENEEWGTFTCRWKSCLSTHFTDKQTLVRHLQKHAKSPLWCAYEGCDHSFASASELLHHHQSQRHHDGQLRKSCYPAPSPENRRQLSPLPDVLPAYMFAVRPIRRHPISRDRHQWVGPKVLENITSFKYTGRRSNAAQPSRLSRRLAEKVVAVELASVTPESGHAQIRRWIDDEYLDFADGYDASRRYRLWCADIPAGEVTQMVHDGLALFVDSHGHGHTGGEEGEDGGEVDRARKRMVVEEPAPPRGGEAPPERTKTEAQGPTIRLKLTLPRRSNVIRLPPRLNQTEAGRGRDASAVAGNVVTDSAQTPTRASESPVSARPQPQLPEPAGASSPQSPSQPSLQHQVSVPEPSTDEVLGSTWTVWPPAKEEGVETH